MPPKQRITREMILERSFAMFCREGMDAVNARSVAKALNCSTQPIFSYFSGMDDLKNALDQKARDTFELALTGAAKGGKLALEDCCMAYVRFSTDQPCLFAHLFLRTDGERDVMPLGIAMREAVAQAEGEHYGLSIEQAREVCLHLGVFAHGLAAIQSSRRSAMDQEKLDQMIAKTHEALIARFSGENA